MDSSFSPKDEIWFLRVCHHISNAVYNLSILWTSSPLLQTNFISSDILWANFKVFNDPPFWSKRARGRGGPKNNRNYFFFEWFIRFYTITTLVSFKVLSIWLRSLNLRGSRNLGKITGQISCPQFRLSLLGSLASLRTYRHLAVKVGKSKGRGKQWQTTPKNLPRMQCARAILVTGLGSGSCQPGL